MFTIMLGMLQYVIPFLVTIGLAVTGVAKIEPYDDAWIVRMNEPIINSSWMGLTYGGFIFVSGDETAFGTAYEFVDKSLIQHEYGHVLQQNILSVWYLPLIAIPSLASAIINNEDHQTFYTETWANELSGYDQDIMLRGLQIIWEQERRRERERGWKEYRERKGRREHE